MQPYFLPYLGYFSLIKHADMFILLDEVQFIRHGWIERNRILKQNAGWLYIQVPLIKNTSYPLIKELKIDNSQKWKEKILAQVVPYKKKAPNYYKVVALLNSIFEKEYNDIVSLNKEVLMVVCNYLGFPKEIEVFSQMNLEIDKPNAPDEWALNICKSLKGADEYWNSQGGADFFDLTKYDNANIKLHFLNMHLGKYNQFRSDFEPGLSILDVMMFNTKEEIGAMLNQFTLA